MIIFLIKTNQVLERFLGKVIWFNDFDSFTTKVNGKNKLPRLYNFAFLVRAKNGWNKLRPERAQLLAINHATSTKTSLIFICLFVKSSCRIFQNFWTSAFLQILSCRFTGLSEYQGLSVQLWWFCQRIVINIFHIEDFPNPKLQQKFDTLWDIWEIPNT